MADAVREVGFVDVHGLYVGPEQWRQLIRGGHHGLGRGGIVDRGEQDAHGVPPTG